MRSPSAPISKLSEVVNGPVAAIIVKPGENGVGKGSPPQLAQIHSVSDRQVYMYQSHEICNIIERFPTPEVDCPH